MHIVKPPIHFIESAHNADPNVLGPYDAVGIKQLETVLREYIRDYLFPQNGVPRGLRKLEAAIEEHLLTTLEEKGVGDDEADLILKNRVPSYEYIRLFYKEGQNICINYMNTLAHFFGVRFIVSNYDFV